jgi:hypothetical protein
MKALTFAEWAKLYPAGKASEEPKDHDGKFDSYSEAVHVAENIEISESYYGSTHCTRKVVEYAGYYYVVDKDTYDTLVKE